MSLIDQRYGFLISQLLPLAILHVLVVQALSAIISDTAFNREARGDAQALFYGATTFPFIVTLILVTSVMGYLKQLSVGLQARSLDITSAVMQINLVKTTLQQVRSDVDSYHDKGYAEALDLAEKVDVQEARPRVVGRQTLRDNPDCDSPSSFYKATITIPFVDHLLTEMNERFDTLQESALVAFKLVPSVCTDGKSSVTPEDLRYYHDDLPSLRTLQHELHMWIVYWKQQQIADIPTTIHETLKANANVATTFPNITTMLHIAATLPVTSCECERSFSSLRRLKTFNRTTMGEERLNGLALLAIHRHHQMDLEAAADTFIDRKPRRMQFASFMAN